MSRSQPRRPHRWIVPAVIAAAAAPAVVATSAQAATTPNLTTASQYLTRATTANGADGTSLAADGWYTQYNEPSVGNHADFGLTIDGGYALAATRSDDQTLRRIATFVDSGHDDAGRTISDYVGLGPGEEVNGAYPYVSSGGIGKTALFAEVVGADPHDFGGHDLIGLLDANGCAAASPPNDYDFYCAGPGAYVGVYSTFSQALAVIALLRAGDTAHADPGVAYLESQQQTDGAFPSGLPRTAGDEDVDSTGMAVMALALASGPKAAAAVSAGERWIASKQEKDGGFPGAAGDSTNSAALALMGLGLNASPYSAKIARGLSFLAGEQNADGGFNVATTGQQGSDVRASTQVVSGIVGTSFGTLSDPVDAPAPPTTTPTTTVTTTAPTPALPTTTVTTTTAAATPSPRARTRTAVHASRVRAPRLWFARRHGRRVVLGASLDVRLTRACTVRVTLSRLRHGRWVRVAARSSRAQAGADTKRIFAPGGGTLAAGRYEITLAARDGDGGSATVGPVRFTVGRP